MKRLVSISVVFLFLMQLLMVGVLCVAEEGKVDATKKIIPKQTITSSLWIKVDVKVGGEWKPVGSTPCFYGSPSGSRNVRSRPGVVKVPACEDRRFRLVGLNSRNAYAYKKTLRQYDIRRIHLDCFGMTDGDLKQYVRVGLFRGLKTLELKNCSSVANLSALLDKESLMVLHLRSCDKLTNLSALVGLKNLTSLDLQHCDGLTDVSALSELKNLTTLYLCSGESVKDVGPLENLEKLEYLWLPESITDGQLRRLRDRGALANVKELSLKWCRKLTDLSALSGLKRLESLDLSGCRRVTDFSGLAGLDSLKSLDLSQRKDVPTDLSKLPSLERLETLDLRYCHDVTNLLALSKLTRLAKLDMKRCRNLTDLTALADLKNLTTLNVTSCGGLKTLDGLGALKNLTTLDVGHSGSLMDISAIAGLKGLTRLGLGYCDELTDLSALAGLENLTFLWLGPSRGPIDLSPLHGMKKLKTLTMSCEDLGPADFAVLASLKSLKHLVFEGAEKITPGEIERLRRELPACWVRTWARRYGGVPSKKIVVIENGRSLFLSPVCDRRAVLLQLWSIKTSLDCWISLL